MMEQILREGLAALSLPTDAAAPLMDFAARLLETNKVMNLTAITEPEDVARLHLLDCAALLNITDFRGKRVVDVGTGAGFPGMPLRILEPDFDLTLLDSLGKRIAFLQRVCDEMGLQRVTCVHARAEEFAVGDDVFKPHGIVQHFHLFQLQRQIRLLHLALVILIAVQLGKLYQLAGDRGSAGLG